jgi:hypothetical protein
MSAINFLRRGVVSTVSALVFAALAVSPALADAEAGHTGTVGFHALVDKGNKGGATCEYKRVTPSPGGYSYEAKLKWINVRAPKVRAISGSQEVGWRFMVERQIQENLATPWVLRYTSPIQKHVTNSTTNAQFSTRGINVNVGTAGVDDEPVYLYRVKVKMFWYMPDGSVQGTATHLVEFYKLVFNNYPGGTVKLIDEFPCRGWTIGSIN